MGKMLIYVTFLFYLMSFYKLRPWLVCLADDTILIIRLLVLNILLIWMQAEVIHIVSWIFYLLVHRVVSKSCMITQKKKNYWLIELSENQVTYQSIQFDLVSVQKGHLTLDNELLFRHFSTI